MGQPDNSIYEHGFSPTPGQRVVIESVSGDLQVVACAGSGKTESISRRVAEILRNGAPPESVVAFTFTEKAAKELKERITKHVRRVLGEEAVGRMGRMYVGTIHGYCYRVLTEHRVKFGNHEVLDEHRHQAFVHRHRKALNLEALAQQTTGKKVPGFEAAAQFISAVDAAGNELLSEASFVGSPFQDSFRTYRELLKRHRFLTFGFIISETVHALETDTQFRNSLRHRLRHLLVDEYQDVNPAQERLIDLLTERLTPDEPEVGLCVVGDDDQAIYQWRGSDVGNILNFEPRRKAVGKCVTVARLTDNRRSRPEIVQKANTFASSIPGRLAKEMSPKRDPATPAVIPWSAETEQDEAEAIGRHIQALRKKGLRYADVAVLLRSVKTSAPPLIAAFTRMGIPFNCGGRTGLFLNAEADAFGELFAWVADSNWRDGGRFDRTNGTSPYRPATETWPAKVLSEAFELTERDRHEFELFLRDWKKLRLSSGGKGRISFVGDYYRILEVLGVRSLTPDQNTIHSTRLGIFARFSEILADFESIAFRGRKQPKGEAPEAPDPDLEFVSASGTAEARNKAVWGSLANFLLNYAKDNYEDFEGETTSNRDEVAIFTVHQAKGLEWPVVFVASLTNRRFPSTMTGRAQSWMLPDSAFGADKRARYEGSDADERRLFYVAVTRARDVVYLSHPRRRTNSMDPSPYLLEFAGVPTVPDQTELPLPNHITASSDRHQPIELSFSDLADHEHCGHAYRLSRVFGFQREVADELGYGHAVHHILRAVAEFRRTKGRTPSVEEINRLVERELFVPFASRAYYEQLERTVKTLVATYAANHPGDLERVWATERPFEIRFPKGTIAGRADVILDQEGGLSGALAIVDYKVNTDPTRDARYARQLQVYAEAARAEGLSVDGLYLHSIRGDKREAVPHLPEITRDSIRWAERSADRIANGTFEPNPEPVKCADCDFVRVCHSRKSDPKD